MLEFATAAQAAVHEETAQGEEQLLEFTVAGEKFAARRPTPGQVNILFSARAGESTRILWDIFRQILVDVPEIDEEGNELPLRGPDSYERLRKLVWEGKITPALLFGGDELNSRGILDGIIAEFAGRPTESSTGSAASPRSTGRKSTGRSPGKGSTLSASD